MQALNGGQGDAGGVGRRDVSVVSAQGEGVVEVLGDGTDMALGRIIGLVVPDQDGQILHALEDVLGINLDNGPKLLGGRKRAISQIRMSFNTCFGFFQGALFFNFRTLYS